MSNPILITGAAGGQQGSTGRVIATLLLEQGLPVRACVHKLDARSDELRQKGAEIIEGDLLNPASVQAAMKDVKRAYFTYPVADGLLEATTIFATSGPRTGGGGVEVVNNSQFQGTPDDPLFRDLQRAPSFRNLQHRLAESYFRLGADWGRSYSSATLFLEKRTRACQPQRGRAKCRVPALGRWRRCHSAHRRRRRSPGGRNSLAASNAPSEKVYPLVEGETLTVRQIVETLGKAIGRPIRYVPITRRAVGGCSEGGESIPTHSII